jgi:hypothetical protein
MSDWMRINIRDLRSISWCESLLWRWKIDQGWSFCSSSHIGEFKYGVRSGSWLWNVTGLARKKERRELLLGLDLLDLAIRERGIVYE